MRILILEPDSKMWAFEMKWPVEAKSAFFKTFTYAYSEHELGLINHDNFFEGSKGEF